MDVVRASAHESLDETRGRSECLARSPSWRRSASHGEGRQDPGGAVSATRRRRSGRVGRAAARRDGTYLRHPRETSSCSPPVKAAMIVRWARSSFSRPTPTTVCCRLVPRWRGGRAPAVTWRFSPCSPSIPRRARQREAGIGGPASHGGRCRECAPGGGPRCVRDSRCNSSVAPVRQRRLRSAWRRGRRVASDASRGRASRRSFSFRARRSHIPTTSGSTG